MHKYIDEKVIEKVRIIETHRVKGSVVEVAEIRFWITELQAFAKKKKSTLWPKSWPIEKIERLTKEAAGNVFEVRGNRYRGYSKNNLPIEFFIDDVGRINNSYIYTEGL